MLLKFLTKTEVKKNLTISLVGVGLGQLIHLLITPVISRIYTPEQFGDFSLFLSIIGILTSISLMKFDLALIICDKDEVGSIYKIIQRLCLALFFVSLCVVFILFLYKHEYLEIAVFSTIGLIVFNQFWSLRAILNKFSFFKVLALSKIYENTINGISTIAIGILGFKDIGLFIGKILGVLTAVLFFRNKTKNISPKSSKDLKHLFSKYSTFPKYSFPAELINNLNVNSIIFLFTYFFTSLEVGFIGLTSRVLLVPTNFVSISFLDVFKQKAVSDYKDHGQFDTIFLKFFGVLFFLALMMILLMSLFGPTLFEFFFGEKWLKAGIYAKYISVLYALRFVSYPLSFSFEITGKNHINLFFESVYLVVGLAVVVITYLLTKNDVTCLSVYSLTLSAIYLIHILLAYLNSKKASSAAQV